MMNTELKFNIINTQGDAILRANLDSKAMSGYIIDQEGDKFNVGFFEPGGFNYIFKDLLTIYTALDYANSHYHHNLLPPEDQYIMPIRQELEIFEDESPDRPRSTGLVIGTEFIGNDTIISYRFAKI